MQVLLAVIDDLWTFAKTALFGFFVETTTTTHIDTHNVHEGYSPQMTLLPEKKTELLLQAQDEQNFIQGEEYFVGVAEGVLYTDPVIAFDTALCTVPYGSLVLVEKLGGRWACVTAGPYKGWMLKDQLLEQAKDVFPLFQENTLYDAHNAETKKLRLCIFDDFQGGAIETDLTDVEYVMYRLFRRQRNITWGTERPRTAGTWQKKLRGKKNVHMSIHPKQDTIMEYVQEDIGHVVYVEAVFPDASMALSTVGVPTEGNFAQMTLHKEEWKELRPVFIEVT